jgi:hypothetical protein
MWHQLNSALFHRLSLTGRAKKAMSFTVKIWTLLSVHILVNPFWHLKEHEKKKNSEKSHLVHRAMKYIHRIREVKFWKLAHLAFLKSDFQNM